MGYWADLRQAYWTMDPDYVESVWWALKQIFDKGLLVAGPPGRAVLPALRHRPVRPRAGAGLRDGRRPVGLRPLPADLRPAGRPGRPAGLDDHAVDAGVQHGRRRPPGRDLRGRDATARGTLRRRRAAAGAGRSARAGGDPGEPSRPRAGALDVPAPVRPASDDPGRRRTTSCWPTTSPPRTAPAWCTRRRPSAPTTSRSAAAYGLPVVNPVARRRHLPPRRCRWSAASSSRTPTRRWSPTCATRGLLFRHSPYEHCYPHCWRCHTAAAVLRAAVLVHPHHRDQGRAARGERGTNWFPATIKHGRYGDWLNNNIDWALSAQPLLGHPAADLAQ